jgi:regulator of cell morphogenesis and NO signaling
MKIEATRTVGELAAGIPSATRLFEKVGIDYCCGGGRTLTEACAMAGVATEEVARSLEQAEQAHAAASEFKDWQSAPLSELISYILSKHHVFTRQELERLERLLSKVCSVHGPKHPELLSINSLFQEMKQELLVHMQKEEAVLFPYVTEMENAAINKRAKPQPFFGTVRNPVRMMMLEHDSAGDVLKEIRKLSRDYTVPDGTCISYQTLYQALEGLEQDLRQHIHLENNILFPRAIEAEGRN